MTGAGPMGDGKQRASGPVRSESTASPEMVLGIKRGEFTAQLAELTFRAVQGQPVAIYNGQAEPELGNWTWDHA